MSSSVFEPTQGFRLKPLLRSPLAIVTVAFGLRMAFILTFHFYRFSDNHSTFLFGWEMGSVARSLATGHGFSSPCPIPTGPTAMIPPVFPLLLAGIFELFGVYSDASGLVVLTLNCILSSLTCLTLVWMGRKTFGEAVGVVAAWIWAFWPMALWEAHRVWETSLSAFLFSLVFLSVLDLKSRSRGFTVGCGLLWGLTALTNPAILAFLIPAVAWSWFAKGKGGTVCRRHLLAATTMGLLTVSPWLARNYLVFHRFIPIRDNFPLELYLGNHPMSPGQNRYVVHVCDNDSEAAQLRLMGEPAYMDMKGRETFAYIANGPGDFAKRVLGRISDIWVGTRIWLDMDINPSTKRILISTLSLGKHILFVAFSGLGLWGLFLALDRKISGAELLLFMVLFPPLPYYFTHAENKYRHPIEPMLMLLVAAPVVMLWKKNRSQGSVRGTATSAIE